MYAFGILLCAAGTLVLAFAQTVWLAVIAEIIFGGSNGMINLPAWAMRQRRTDSAMFGRVLAISMSLNLSGIPIGSALAGPLARSHTELALILGAVCCVVGSALAWWLIPARHTTGQS